MLWPGVPCEGLLHLRGEAWGERACEICACENAPDAVFAKASVKVILRVFRMAI